MKISTGLKRLISNSLTGGVRRSIGHIKNMNEENVRVLAEQMVHEPDVEVTNRVYKPSYTIEFNREG